jgi:hypothetical protein
MMDIESITVTTYVEMKLFRDQFVGENGLPFLVVVGSPGLSKSQMFRRHLPEGSLYLSGALSAVQLFVQLYRHQDQFVMIDDMDSLFRDPAAVNLEKNLCNTDIEKTLFWNKQNHQLEKLGIPTQFTTRSRVCILANTLDHINPNLAAVLDRGVVVRFEPTFQSMHEEVRTWFTDDEIYEFIGSHRRLISQPSMRYYARALSIKSAGGDWKDVLLRYWTHNDIKLQLTAQICDDAALTTAEERVKRFADLGCGSRATFMRKQKEWRDLVGDRAAA